ncbi:hypothetical protein ABK040_006429 [Willaertia magna]
MFKGVVVEANAYFGDILYQKLVLPLFKDLFTIIDCVESNNSTKWLEIIPKIDIIFFSASSVEFSEEVVQLINTRIQEKKLTLFFFRFVSGNNIARQLQFYKDQTDSSMHFDYGKCFKLNFNDFDKLFTDNYHKLSYNVQNQLNQFTDTYGKEIKVMKGNNFIDIGNQFMNGVILTDLTCVDDWYILAENLEKNRGTILLHKNCKVCFCHWYYRLDDNEFSNCLLKLTFSYVLLDHLNDKNIVKYFNNLKKRQEECKLTDIDIN